MSPRLWLVVFLAVVGTAILLQAGFVSFALYALVTTLLASRLSASGALRGFEDARECRPEKLNAGEVAHVFSQVTNATPWWVPWALIEDLVPEKLEKRGENIRLVTMTPGRKIRLAYQLECKRRGYYQIGPTLCETGDIFGLVRGLRVGPEVKYITVLPRVVPIARHAAFTHRPVAEVRARRSLFEDPARVVGVRPYQPGDELDRIHWKATAHTGQLQSKVYEPTTLLGATLALDFHARSYEGEEGEETAEFAAVVAASLANYIAAMRQQVGFIANGRDAAERGRLGPEEAATGQSRAEMRSLAMSSAPSQRARPVEAPARRGSYQAMSIWETLARLELSDGMTMTEMLLKEHPRLPRELALFVLTPRAHQGLCEALAMLQRVGFSTTLFVLRNPDAHAEATARLSGMGIGIMHLNDEGELNALAVRRL